MQIDQRIGEDIRKGRKILGLTQKQLGEKAGVSQPYISKIEKNKIPIIEKSVEKVLKQLGVFGTRETKQKEFKEMKTEKTKKAIKTMTAFISGDIVIQCALKDTLNKNEQQERIWIDDLNPVWNWEKYEYREKPNPKYRPFTATEALIFCFKNIIHKEKEDLVYNVYAICPEGVYVTDRDTTGFLTFEQLLKSYLLENGEILGVIDD